MITIPVIMVSVLGCIMQYQIAMLILSAMTKAEGKGKSQLLVLLLLLMPILLASASFVYFRTAPPALIIFIGLTAGNSIATRRLRKRQ